MKKWLLLVVGLSMCASVQAQTLRFVAEDLPPYHYHNSNGKIDGMLVDVVKAVVNAANLQAEIELMPMARAVHELSHNANTLMFSLLKTHDREDDFKFLGATFHATAYLFGLKAKTFALNNLEDAQNYRVSTIRGYHSARYLLENGFSEEENLVLATEFHSLWQMLYLQRTDLVMTNALTIEKEIRDSGLEPSLIEEKFAVHDFPSELHIAANKKLPVEIATALTVALKSIKKNGEYEAILKKWKLE
ncbi:transporter substrate-binding domain-containing protein [Pseudoalteromonas xiamenensis]|uniref:substrate-binding periplasmic protein n=1 Tax=Pseudoalteromonas xiamenensis TaxID=882626 RepID=UPI0027E484FD|nr:transporter substrate-binding domain-containing protein [Pseudoalteromonas xiamenensis]WMN60982.1 transporter substrate-binding domain-containing protein [Pseudoalteromonas xiamenensis]